jgi:beta-lactamase regulating signal transducer with metallopeptidase domain
LAPLSISTAWLPQPIVQDAIDSDEAAVEPISLAEPALFVPVMAEDVVGVANEFDSLPEPVQKPAVIASLPEPIAATPIAWSLWALEFLLVGTVLVIGLTVRRLMQLAGVIRRSAPVDEGFRRRVDVVAETMLGRRIAVRFSKEITSPCVSCLGRPSLLWPESLSCDGDEAHAVIAHELAHVARRDHWVAWLELPVLLACWWNPVFWMVRHQLHETRELACDAISLASAPERRRIFAETLLRLSHGPKSVNLAVSMVETGFAARSSLRRRLQMVFDSKVSGRRSFAGLGLAGLLAVAVLPGLSLGQDEAPRAEAKELPLAAPSTDAAADVAPLGLPKPEVAPVKTSADVVEAKRAVEAVPPAAGASSAADAASVPPVAANRTAAWARVLAGEQVQEDGSHVLQVRLLKGNESYFIVRLTRDGQKLLSVVSSDGSRSEFKISDAEAVETTAAAVPATASVDTGRIFNGVRGQTVREDARAQGGIPQLGLSTNGLVRESAPVNQSSEGLEDRREDLELAKLNLEEKLVELESAQAENTVSADQSTIRKVKLAELGVKRAKVEMNRAARALRNAETAQQQSGLQRM